MDSSYTRRGLIKAGAGATTGLAAASTVSGQEDAYGGYLSNDDSWSGTTGDGTGKDKVTIKVGASGNTGSFAFGPSAVVVDPGTTVRWRWTGKGGSHNVVSEKDAFKSKLTDKEGFEFTHTFESEGVYRYYCQPHKTLGMKGVVAVGKSNAETDLEDIEELLGTDDHSAPPSWVGAGVFGLVSLLGVAAYHELFEETE